MSRLDKTSFLIGKIHWMSRRLYEKKISQFNLTPPQLEVLSILWKEDGLFLSELSKRVSRDGSTMSGMIDRLEKKGLVKRQRNHIDRRTVRVLLTTKAKRLKNKLIHLREKFMDEIAGSLSNKEIQMLETVLIKILNNLNKQGLRGKNEKSV